jgi:hypothetical protein
MIAAFHDRRPLVGCSNGAVSGALLLFHDGSSESCCVARLPCHAEAALSAECSLHAEAALSAGVPRAGGTFAALLASHVPSKQAVSNLAEALAASLSAIEGNKALA